MKTNNKILNGWKTLTNRMFKTHAEKEMGSREFMNRKNNRVELNRLTVNLAQCDQLIQGIDLQIAELKAQRRDLVKEITTDTKRIDRLFEDVYGEQLAKRYAEDIKDYAKASAKKDLEKEHEESSEPAKEWKKSDNTVDVDDFIQDALNRKHIKIIESDPQIITTSKEHKDEKSKEESSQ